jgi:hypothetical protein
MRDHLIQLKCRTLFVAAIALCWTSALEAARCPAFSERMQLKPDPDLLQWPVAQQIGSHMSIPERMIRLGDRDVKLYVGRYTGKDHFTAGFSALVRASSAHFNDHVHFSGVVREVVVGTADDQMTVVCVIVDTAEFIN